VFGRVERASIVKNMPLADLIRLFDNCKHVKDLLHLQVFTARQRTTLSASVGKAIAKLILLMFGSTPTCGLHHIETFVCCVIESWLVLERTPQDTVSASYAFVATLSPYMREKEDLVRAFTRGVKKGIDTIEFFAKRRTPRRRTT
jgi:hypothetical protein